MSIPNVGEWIATQIEIGAAAYVVQRRTKRKEQVFLWCDNFTETPLVLPADECEPLQPATTEIEWANMAIAEATDECALEMYAIFMQAYSTPEDWRRQVWAGLTLENQAKIRRFKAIFQGEEVAA
ncbi:MAG TPA: hypothetical protein V6C57_07550 [Coleofasciculaceae cyanobacterium]